jgi:hypothetical protein
VPLSTEVFERDPDLCPPREAYVEGCPGWVINEVGQIFSCRMRGKSGHTKGTWHPVSYELAESYIAKYWTGRRMKSYRVRFLVARAFLGPSPPGHYLASIDGDLKNHRLANLEYRPGPRPNPRSRRPTWTP